MVRPWAKIFIAGSARSARIHGEPVFVDLEEGDGNPVLIAWAIRPHAASHERREIGVGHPNIIPCGVVIGIEFDLAFVALFPFPVRLASEVLELPAHEMKAIRSEERRVGKEC